MDTKQFEDALLKEKKTIEETLSTISKRNPNNPSDWEAQYPDFNVAPSDKGDLADEVEQYDKALGLNSVLETKLREIDDALAKIKDGKYGKCEVGGDMIDEKRLNANAAARTCMEHQR